MGDGCEWSPKHGRATFDNERHHLTCRATTIVGAKGQWRLCDSCAALPAFKRFTVRRPIVRWKRK